jgi:hypothetical protein
MGLQIEAAGRQTVLNGYQPKRVLPERPTMNGGPACLVSRLKTAVHPQLLAVIQSPSGSLPRDRPVDGYPRVSDTGFFSWFP